MAKKKKSAKKPRAKGKRQTRKGKPAKKTRPGKKKTTKKKTRAGAPVSTPSSILKIAVTLPGPGDQVGPTAFGSRMSAGTINDFIPDPITVQKALGALQGLGFSVTSKGRVSASVRGERSLFEKVFGTRLSPFHVKPTAGRCSVDSFYFPKPGAAWRPQKRISALIDDAYIQWPHIYMNQLFPATEPSPIPPRVDYHHLRVPGDVALLLNAARVHREGVTGLGVRVAMVDSGFAHGHAYFHAMGYNTSVALAPGATDPDLDGNGHGTGESANLLAIAPDVNFIGVKLDNENDPFAGASLLEGFQEAVSHDPDIISVSLGFDLVPIDPSTGQRISNEHLTSLPNSLVALEAEISAAVANGIIVVFSAGNGHVAFPGMMPDVVSAGGVFVDEDGSMRASDYASGFTSKIYPGRHVPDVCGLVGLAANSADYIMLPLQSACDIDATNFGHDGTSATDGWGVFSGTSAAAPQLAGVCALLKQQNPGLTPSDIRNVLRLTARDVALGNANAASNEGTPAQAGPGPDNATGAGLVDAFAAWRHS